MPWLINLFIGFLFSYIAYLLRPTPPPPKAATLEDFNIPVARQGEEIPMIYGTVWMKSVQVHWYGDFYKRAIQSQQGKK